jgi:hypothetical protein
VLLSSFVLSSSELQINPAALQGCVSSPFASTRCVGRPLRYGEEDARLHRSRPRLARNSCRPRAAASASALPRAAASASALPRAAASASARSRAKPPPHPHRSRPRLARNSCRPCAAASASALPRGAASASAHSCAEPPPPRRAQPTPPCSAPPLRVRAQTSLIRFGRDKMRGGGGGAL